MNHGIRVGVIGAGAWGAALSILSQKAGNDVILWSYDGEVGNHKIAWNGRVTDNLADLSDTDVWLVATPAEFFGEIMSKSRLFYKNQPIIICTKGMDGHAAQFMSETLLAKIPESTGKIGVFSGGGYAGEVAAGIPTGYTLAGSKIVQKVGQIALKGFYLELTQDIVGTEVCSTGKNAVAVLAGYLFGKLGEGHENEKALRITLAWNEIIKLGRTLGAKLKTFNGFCGVGDLLLTATSRTSRNFTAGVMFANGESPDDTITVEGLSALHGLLSRAKKAGVEMPVLSGFAKEIRK